MEFGAQGDLWKTLRIWPDQEMGRNRYPWETAVILFVREASEFSSSAFKCSYSRFDMPSRLDSKFAIQLDTFLLFLGLLFGKLREHMQLEKSCRELACRGYLAVLREHMVLGNTDAGEPAVPNVDRGAVQFGADLSHFHPRYAATVRLSKLNHLSVDNFFFVIYDVLCYE
jgi:hypothetical protein